jgi:predicted dehydrogenase
MGTNLKNLKVLVAGCGSIGRRHVRVLTSLGVNNIMAFDTNQKQFDLMINESPDVRQVSTFEDGLEKADAAFILTPTRLHIPMAIQAVKAGCHVFIEKPLSVNMDGVIELEELASKTGKKIMVGLCFRYHEGIQKAKKMLDIGRIGRLVSIRALVGENFPEIHPEYKSLYYAKYSGAFELMHDLDLAIWFAGQPVKNVYSVFGSYSDIGIEAPDIVEFLMNFADRCIATVHLDFFQFPRRRQLELIGTNGVIIIEFASWDEYTLSVYNTEKRIWESETNKTVRDDMFRAEDSEFLEFAIQDRPIICDIQEGCKSLQVIEAAQKKISEVTLIKPR